MARKSDGEKESKKDGLEDRKKSKCTLAERVSPGKYEA